MSPLIFFNLLYSVMVYVILYYKQININVLLQPLILGLTLIHVTIIFCPTDVGASLTNGYIIQSATDHGGGCSGYLMVAVVVCPPSFVLNVLFEGHSYT